LILETALEIFATYGYHAASISMIAQHAVIAKGLLYNYFESKEALLKAVINNGFKDFFDIFTPLLDKNFPEKMFTPEEFRKLIKKVFKIMSENIHFWRLYFALAFQPGVAEIIYQDYKGMMISQFDLLNKYYKKQGSKNSKADAVHANSVMDGLMINIIQSTPNFDDKKIIEKILRSLEKPIY
jgi:AcrR family transcriptional regulator